MAKALNVSLAVTADTGQAKQQLQQLQQSLQQLTTSSANLKIGISAEEIQKASQAALELSAHLKTATNVNTGTIDFTKLNSSIRSSGQSLEQYGQQLLKLGPQGRQAFIQLAQSVAKSEIPIKRLSSLLGNMGTVLANTIRWQLSSSMIHGFMGAIQTAYGYAQDLNKSLNNIQIVTQMSDTQMGKFAVTANKAAKALNTTTTSYTDAALIYYQQGIRDEKEITQRTNATIKMANVTGQSAQEVSNQMTAIWNNFADGATNLEYYADVITALGAATASSSEEISRGLEKFAAIADTVGLSYENATAALATITATTRQSADTVGTGLRTLFSRLQSLSLGETLEDGVNLTKYSKALKTVGVEVLDATGNLRRMDDILLDLGDKWDGLTKAQQTALAQTVGGVRQYTTLVALMDNIDFYKENLEVAKNSEGTLERQQQTYEKSWAAAAKRVRASAESIYSNLIDDSFFTKLTDNFAKFLDILNNVITGLGGMKGILLSLGGALTSTFSDKAAAGLYKFGVGIRDMFTSPKALAGRRDAFVANAAGIYAGLPVDTRTGYIQGAIFNKKTGQLDMSGVSMTSSQSQMYNAMASQLAIQQAYSRNASFMTPEQQLAAQMAMDQQTRTADALFQAQERNKQSQQAVGTKVGDLYGQIMSSNKRGSLGRIISDNGTYTMPDGSSIKLDNDTAASILDTTRTNFESNDRQYAQALDMLGKMQRGEMSSTGLTKEQRSILGLQKGESLRGAGRIEAKQAEFEKARQANRLSAQQEFTKFGGSSSAFSAYANAYQESLKAGMTEEEAKKAAEQAKKNAEEAANKTSPGMKFAQGAVNVAGGLMSATAAQAGLESLTNTIQQANAGLISTKDAATQGMSAVASMAMNGARAFQSFSAVLGPIGGAIATIATVALPYIIDGFDKLYETDEEKMARLNKSVEMAQEDLAQSRQEYKDIFTDFSNYNKAAEGIKKMTAGTREFKDAVRDANIEAKELIDKYNLTDSDYYTDSNGVIRFRKGTDEKIAKEKDKEIDQKEYLADTAEFARDAESLRQDRKRILKAEEKANELFNTMAQTVDSTTGAVIGYNDTVNGMTRDEFITKNMFKYLDESFAKQYGYSSTQDMATAYREDNSLFFDRMQTESGIIQQYSKILEDQAKSDDGVISDSEKIINEALKNSFDAFSEELQLQSSKDGWFGGEKEYVKYKTENGEERVNIGDTNNDKDDTARRERVYRAQLKELYNEEEAEQIYWDLIGSTGYTGLKEQQKQERLNQLLQQQELQILLQKSVQAQTELLGDIDTKKYEGYQNKTAREMHNLFPEGMKDWYLNDEGVLVNASGETVSNDLLVQANILKSISEQWGQAAETLYSTLLGTTDLNINIDAIREMSRDFSQTDLETLTSYVNIFGETFGSQSASFIFSALANDIRNNKTELLDALNEIDWSDSQIENLFSLKTAIDNFRSKGQDEVADQFESIFVTAYTDIGRSAGLLKELYQDEDFITELETFKTSFEETGEINADSILKASKNCKVLSKFLDIAAVNAQGLADVIESITIGDIGIDQVSEGLLVALSVAGELENTLSEVYQHIDNFSLDRSITDIGKFYKGLTEQIESSQGAGMLLDSPLLQSWKELFGQDSLDEYKQWVNDVTSYQEQLGRNLTPDEISNLFNEQFGAEVAAMQSIQKRGNLSGMFEYAFNRAGQGAENGAWNEITDAAGKLKVYADSTGQIFDATGEKLMHFDETTGQVVTDNDVAFQQMFAHQSDFIDYLADNLDIPRDMAEAMAAEFAATDGWAHDMWGTQAAEDGFNQLLGVLKNGYDLNGAEVKAFYNQYSEFFKDIDGLENIDSVESFIEYLTNTANAANEASGSIIDLGDSFDYTKGTYKELQTAMGGEDNLNKYIDKKVETKEIQDTGVMREDGSTGISVQAKDVKDLQQAYMALGLSASKANEMINSSGQKLSGTYHDAKEGLVEFSEENADYLKWVKENYGKDATSSAETMLAYQDFKNQEAQIVAQAEIFAKAFQSVTAEQPDITLNYTLGNLESVIAEGLGIAEAAFGEIPLHWGDLPPIEQDTVSNATANKIGFIKLNWRNPPRPNQENLQSIADQAGSVGIGSYIKDPPTPDFSGIEIPAIGIPSYIEEPSNNPGGNGGANGAGVGTNALCLIGKTKILLSNGLQKNIEDIKIGDYVYSYNEKTKKIEIDQVVETFCHNNNSELVKIEFEQHNPIIMTFGHPLLTLNGWKSLNVEITKKIHNVIATLLQINDMVIFYNGIDIITNIETYSDKVEFVYNITTEKNHTYFANGAITHNKYTGYNNHKNLGFSDGLKAGEYEGWADLGEQGEELWIHDGTPYLAGIHGRTQGYIHKDDIVYTHPQTEKILKDNPSLQNIPGFSVGYNPITWDSKKSSNASADNAKTSKYDPERYHLITRQLKDLQREYDRLSKIKDNAYGTNKLDAIQREINATDKLIEGQKALIKEAEDYKKIDTDRLKQLLEKDEFQIDANGNLLNFEELQEKYRRAAEENKDEHAQDVWKALNQYEETIDKLNDANVEMQDLLYQLSELALEKIQTKVELVVEMDDREIKFIDHFLNKLDDEIYDAAEALGLVEQKMAKIKDQIDITGNGLQNILKEMRNDYGEELADNDKLTLDKILEMGKTMSGEEIAKALDPLHINGDFGEAIEKYTDNLLDYIEALEELKTEGVDRLTKAFDKMNDNISKSMDLFNYYNEVLSTMKTITELQGTNISKQMRDLGRELNRSILSNTLNQLDTERANYASLQDEVNDLQKKLNNTTDESLKIKYQELLDKAKEKMRESNKSILSLIQDGLDQAKTMFETTLDDIASDYSNVISGMYGSLDELQNAFNRKKDINDFYVDDYEKYYQIAKLQRSITSDLDKAARAGNRSNQGLKKLYDEINAARESGVELTEYDLDVFSKRYEYEKALMELEDARNAKSEVRLQRDANGNWGYVYTSSADEDDLLQKQQAVDDKLHDWQQTVDNQADEIQGTILNTISSIMNTATDMLKSGASKEAVDDYINDSLIQLDLYTQKMGTSLSDALKTVDIAKERYGNASFDILDNYGETILSSIMNMDLGSIHDYITSSVSEAYKALEDYNKEINRINIRGGFEDVAIDISNMQKEIDKASIQTTSDTIEMIDEYGKTFDDLLIKVKELEDSFFEKYGDEIEKTENMIKYLLNVLDALNRYEIKDEGAYKSKPVVPAKTSSNNNQDEKSNTEEEEESKPCPHKWEETAGSHPEGMYYIHVQKCLWCGARRTFKTLYSASGPKAVPMDTGGYTGSWGTEGRIAMLHEKELVLNKDDTKNFLDATNILRTIDLQTNMFSKGLGNIITPWIDDMRLQELEQDVHIEASFPNVVDHNEIEMAFDNLINKASQYANRKNMSSMTFQDMYTSKF